MTRLNGAQPCRLLSQHTALQAWNLVCLDRLSPCGSRPPAYGRGRFHSPAALHPVLGITLGIHEVDGQRGTITSSDLPEIPSGGFMKTALFQPSLPEPCRRLSAHTALQGCGSTGLGLIPLRFAASTAPVGFCPPSPAPLLPVLGITPGIRVLRVLCDPAARAV
jgi:hypothetical protein